MSVPKISLEQWQVLVSIVEQGSFARAAEALNKSQSAVSYAIAQLNQQLPVAVLETRGRKAELTEAGQVLYRRGKQLLAQALDIEQMALCLAQGMETQLTLAVDAIVPMARVLQALAEFGRSTPHTRVVLLETTLSGTSEALLERRADLVLTAQIPPGFLAEPIGEVSMIPVAASSHPLAQASQPLSEQDLRQSRQIVVRDSGRHDQNQGWLGSEQRFTVSHFATSLQALEAGLGFAFVPDNLVAEAVAHGRLCRLKLALQAQRKLPIYLIQVSRDHIGPANQRLVRALQQQFMVQAVP